MRGWRGVIIFSSLLMVILCSQSVYAQQRIEQEVYAIFQESCLNCHGEFGSFSDILIMDYTTLIEKGIVIPDKPDESELYRRLLGPTENGAQMPFIGDPLTTETIDTIRLWIEDGAPTWEVQLDVEFIPTDAMLETIENHVKSLASFDRPFARYFTLTHLYNAAEIPEVLNAYKIALSKLINSLSWGVDVVNPSPIDLRETIFYIDLRHYEWDIRKEPWTLIEQVYPYKLDFNPDTQAGLLEKMTFLRQEMECDVPFVNVDWFLATASLPPLYHDILDLPETDRELEQLLLVDVARNLQTAPGIRVQRAGLTDSRVSSNNRVLERHTSQYGAYWRSYDFAGSVGAQNILTHPLSFKQDGGEAIFNLPNGLQAYYISDASGNRINEAPINIVSNPAASDPVVRNGLSCIGCHTEGMQTFEDVVRAAALNSPETDARDQVLRLYVEQSKINDLIDQDKQRYRTALEATGGVFGGIEPVHRFYEAFQGPIDAAYAAAAVGLETEAFLQKIRDEQNLRNLGLAGLLDGSNVKRDVWTSNFADIISEIYTPDQGIDPPVPPPIDLLPGELIYIPDVNLRAAIEAALSKASGAVITAEDMGSLTRIIADDKGISDLRGLEAGIRLERIEFRRNSITDLSPLAGLTRLNDIKLRGNEISDISALAGLINLVWLGLEENDITDLSPLKNLNKLSGIGLDGNPITDLLPLAGLVSLQRIQTLDTSISDFSVLASNPRLRWIEYSGDKSVTELPSFANLNGLDRLLVNNTSISDISELKKLTRLDRLTLHNNLISDLTGLAELKNLTYLNLQENVIVNVSPLSGLTKLKELNLRGNIISDVSHLAGLINLDHLNLRFNAISDFSPLEPLFFTTNILASENPGVLRQGGPKIEGPWLWVLVPGRLSGTDFLSVASKGDVMELEIAANGATFGDPVGENVWTPQNIPATGGNNINVMLNSLGMENVPNRSDIVYGSISLYSPLEQTTRMYVGVDNDVKVWLNGNLVYQALEGGGFVGDYRGSFSTTLKQGKNVLLVAAGERGGNWSGFFGFSPDTEYSVLSPGARFSFSTETTDIKIGEEFTVDLNLENASDLAGWQSDIIFNPAILEAIGVREGDFLQTDGGKTFIREGDIDNENGIISGISVARTTEGGISGGGTALSVTFRAKALGEPEIALQNFRVGLSTGGLYPSGQSSLKITVKDQITEIDPDPPEPVPPDPPDVSGPGFSFSTDPTSITVEETFTLHLNANDITDLAGWSSDITFDPDVLEVVSVEEGDFLKEVGVTPFFVYDSIDNIGGKIDRISTARLGGVNGTGILLSVTFNAKEIGTTIVTLSNFEAGTSAGVAIPSEPVHISITVEDSAYAAWDVNQDGKGSVLDLIIVAQYLGSPASVYPSADVNGDGTISVLDLIIVAQHIGEPSTSAASPILAMNNKELMLIMVQAWIEQAQKETDGSIAFRQGIENLQRLLASLLPEKTALHANYPNPFNPETWIPYHLAKPADVKLTIYGANGSVIRTLALGHQVAGMYQSRNRAAFWDGKNAAGESVATGVYFYTLTAGEYFATRKMLILK